MRPVLVALIRARPAPESAPAVPASFDVVEECDGWSSIYPRGREHPDVMLHARLVYRPTALRGVYVMEGTAAALQHVADRIAADSLAWTRTWSGLRALRLDAAAGAKAIRDAWPDDRQRLVTSAPGVEPVTYGAAIGTLVAMRSGMAGHPDDGE